MLQKLKAFYIANQVLLSGLISAIVISLQQFMSVANPDWAVIGFAVLLAAASWAGNNLRGKGVSVLGILGVAGASFATVAETGHINKSQLILSFVIGLGALIAPPAKNESYEKSAIITRAKEEGTAIQNSNGVKPNP
jgi:amino acid permease